MLTWAKLGCTVYGVTITGGERVSLADGRLPHPPS
jgi:hypothetical protein